MPRKKKEEELQAETISTESVTEDTVIETASDESAEVSMKSSSIDEETTKETSMVGSIAETIGAAVGSFAATITDGISSVLPSTVSAEVPVAIEADKLHHSKRAERIGIVQSDKMTKTVTVRVDRQIKHPIYRKYIKRRKNFMAHDELGSAIGDKVRIIETRPMSARKRWRVVEILQKAVR